MMNDISALTPVDIVKWFRLQAKVFTQMADTVESTFKAATAGKPMAEQLPIPTMGTVTLEQIKEALKEKPMRIATLAKRFAVERHVIEKLIKAEGSGIKIGDKGWIPKITN
jgi:hypothetical protein